MFIAIFHANFQNRTISIRISAISAIFTIRQMRQTAQNPTHPLTFRFAQDIQITITHTSDPNVLALLTMRTEWLHTPNASETFVGAVAFAMAYPCRIVL